MTPLLAAIAAMCVLAGVCLVVYGLQPRPKATGRPDSSLKRRLAPLAGTTRRSQRLRALGAAGVLVGVLVAIVSGWIIAIVLVPAALVGIPMLLAGSEGAKAIAKVEALEEWTRSLAGVLGAGVGLEQALQATLSRSTPAPIRPEVAMLVARLRSRWSTRAALRAFADDLDDSTGDAIVTGLLLAADRRGPGLARILEGIAERAAEDVRNRRRIEADMARPRGIARWITAIAVVVLGLMAFNGDYIAPYGTFLGQMVLFALLSIYGAGLLWMRRLAQGESTPRFLGHAARAAREGVA